MTNVAPETAAKAAGLSVEELNALEESGQVTKQPNFAALAGVVGLNATKLEGIAKGWSPAVVDMSVCREIRQITTSGPNFSVHCYLVWDEVTREAALFDTGFDAAPIFQIVEAEQLNLAHLFITHSHYDHIEALGAVREKFPKIRIHTDMKSAPPQHKNRRNDCVHLGSLRITNRETTGHAEDGVTYIVGNWSEDAPFVAIVGDAIFAGSMGGAPDHGDLAKKQAREHILTLPAETFVCPGHGPLSTVAQEKAHNPFF